jgi:putative membrane protein
MQLAFRSGRTARPPAGLRLLPALAGVAVLAALWLGPLPQMSRTALLPHMLLHLGVTVIAAPLLALALASQEWLKAGLSQTAGAIFAASLAEMAVVWGWHAPPLHEAAAIYGPVFVVEQASFLVGAMLLWIASTGGTGRGARLVGAAALLFAFMHMAMFGVIFALAPGLIYAPQFCRGSFGFDPLEDQHIAGALMASVGALTYLAGGVVLAFLAVRD